MTDTTPDPTEEEHLPEPLWVPICETCGADVYLDDSETWRHE